MNDHRTVLECAMRVIGIEARAVSSLEESLAGGMGKLFVRAADIILGCRGRVITTGMGKSGIIANKISSTLASTGTSSFFLHPAEALHGDLGRIKKEDVVLALSHSGETEELLRMIPFIRATGTRLISFTGRKNSSLSTSSDVSLYSEISLEACPLNLAPSASTTAALALGDALALAVCSARGFKPEDFAVLHPGGALGRKLFCQVKDVMHSGDKIPVADENTPLREAVGIISDKGFGCVFITKSNQLTGIITDGDLRRIISREHCDFKGKAGDYASLRPKFVAAETYIGQALEEMEKYQITTLAILDHERTLTGIVHLHDLLGRGELRISS